MAAWSKLVLSLAACEASAALYVYVCMSAFKCIRQRGGEGKHVHNSFVRVRTQVYVCACVSLCMGECVRVL